MDISRHLKLIMLNMCFLCQLGHAFGQNQNDMFLTKYRTDIEEYIMTGYGPVWTKCDVIHTDGNSEQQPDYMYETPLFRVDIKKLITYDIKTTFSSSHCLLISAYVSNQSLSDLIKFGWSVIQHKRVALVLTLTHGLTLDMATNTTKLPFLVASRMEDGKEQFLCPMVGEANPQLQNGKCELIYTSYKNKSLRVGIFGFPPAFFGRFFFFYDILPCVIHLFLFSGEKWSQWGRCTTD